jgi:hypothetical protein
MSTYNEVERLIDKLLKAKMEFEEDYQKGKLDEKTFALLCDFIDASVIMLSES